MCQSALRDNDRILLPSGKKSLLCDGLSINPRNKFLYYSISARSSSSMSNCNAGLRCIIWWSICLFDGEYRKKSAMSNPLLRCSSSDVHSKTLDTTTRLHIPDNKADFYFHCLVAPKSGMRVTSLPLRTCIASLLKQPFFPPVASHI